MAAMTISWIQTYMICALTEAITYGICLVLFVLSVQTLLARRQKSLPVNRVLATAAPILFFFATLHIFGVSVRTFKGFVTFNGQTSAYFALITSTEKTLCQVGQLGGIGLGDAMMVYRTWQIWRRNYWVIALPSLTLIGTIVSGIVFVTLQHQVNVHTSIFSTAITQWTEAWLGCSLATTGVCTGLIVFKLLYQLGRPILPTHGGDKDTQLTAIMDSTRSMTTRIISIVVESAVMYFIVNLLYSVLYAVHETPEAWFSGLDVPMASITFSLIIIRIETVGSHERGPSMYTRSSATKGNNTSMGIVSPTKSQGVVSFADRSFWPNTDKADEAKHGWSDAGNTTQLDSHFDHTDEHPYVTGALVQHPQVKVAVDTVLEMSPVDRRAR